MNHLCRLASACVCLTLAACAAPPRPLYQWAGYQPALYQYFKGNGSDTGAQIAQLEAQIQKNAASGEATPPGMHGHLALLYARMGDDAATRRHLEAERAKFPESATYVDFLLKNGARSSAPSPKNPGAPT